MKKKQNKFLKNRNKHLFFYKKKSSHLKKKTKKKNLNNYLYKNRRLKKGIFLKKPKFNEIIYPFFLNMKLINEYLKKK